MEIDENIRRGGLVRPIRKNSLRLKTWDYFLPGPYFFTICTFDRGDNFQNQIVRGKVIEIFKIIAEEYKVAFHGIVVATDHLHGLITLSNDKKISLWQYIGKSKVRITQMFQGQADHGQGQACPCDPCEKEYGRGHFMIIS